MGRGMNRESSVEVHGMGGRLGRLGTWQREHLCDYEYLNLILSPAEERNRIGPITADEELFASKKVTCVGQLIGLVVAKDRATAQRAAKAVRIQYEDIKPCIITIQVIQYIHMNYSLSLLYAYL